MLNSGELHLLTRQVVILQSGQLRQQEHHNGACAKVK